MLSKRKITSGDILQDNLSGSPEAFRKSAEKRDGGLEGGVRGLGRLGKKRVIGTEKFG